MTLIQTITMPMGKAWQRLHRASRPQDSSLLQTVPGAGGAVLRPPGIEASLDAMQQASPNDQYLLPLGWHYLGSGELDLAHTTLVGETNHLLISGTNDCGKDNLAWWMLLSLALQHQDPGQLQVCIIDGKGLDFQPWRHKAHMWAAAFAPEELVPVMLALSDERRRRRMVLEQAEVSKWDAYRGDDLPLLVVFISELSLLESALRRERQRNSALKGLSLESWLNDELTSGRAFGLRYIIGMQTVTGMDMLWRSQIGVALAGYQPDESQVKPNTGRTAAQITAAGAVPPSLLPAPPQGAGVFTVVSGAQAATVRAAYLNDQERRNWLTLLPDHGLNKAAQVSMVSTSNKQDETLLGSRIAGDTVVQMAENSSQKIAPVKNAFAASQSDLHVFTLDFTPEEIAEIGARIALGEKKTEVVKAMRGYDSRRHRVFAGYYDTLYKQLTSRGLTTGRQGEDKDSRTELSSEYL